MRAAPGRCHPFPSLLLSRQETSLSSITKMTTALPAHLQRILDMEYPRFSRDEMHRRRKALETVLAAHELDHLVFYGAARVGSGVQWITQWPVTAEAAGVFTPGRADLLHVHYYNHLALAKKLAADADVAWGGEGTMFAKTIETLKARGARENRVGYIGPLGIDGYNALTANFGHLKNLNRDYVSLRLIKSAEELDWFRIGAHFSDLGMLALRDGMRPGLNERELWDIIERAYVKLGGTNAIHFVGATPMDSPSVGVPRQFPSTRKLESGDVVFAEISANFWEHSGQVLRTFTLGAEPTQLYRDLHATADAAFDAIVSILKEGTTPAEVIAASAMIEDNGFTTIDDLMHGYGGGYFPPIIGSSSRPAGRIPDMPLKAGMMVVVQPNITTQDGTAGVQTGEALVITKTGVARLHAVERGLKRVG
jgi:Xaa-Pro aminopeptidase